SLCQVTTRIMTAPINADDLVELLKRSGYDFSGLRGANPNFEMLARLPAKVKASVAALKNLQVKSIEIEAQFFTKVHELEKQLEAEVATINEQRRKIIAGEYEPTPEEANRPLIHNATQEEITALVSLKRSRVRDGGVPDFWKAICVVSEGLS
ncbi:hypothetical protein PENTCL1PPCAC_1585, partial [Pristionchus entomophagus]